MGDKFFVVLEDGSRKCATPITRLKIDGKNIEYLYYSIDDDDSGQSSNVSILASRIEVKNNQEVLVDLKDEEERQIAYELFSETYKNLKQKNKEEN